MIEELTEERSFELESESFQDEEEQLEASIQELQAVDINGLIDSNNFEGITQYLDCINKTTLAASKKINQLTIEESKLDQQLDILEGRGEPREIEEALERYKKNFNRNCLELKQINNQTEIISNMKIKTISDITVEVLYRTKYKIKIDFAKESWKKLSSIQILSPIEIETEQFKDCIKDCVDKDDLVPLWLYMSKHFD